MKPTFFLAVLLCFAALTAAEKSPLVLSATGQPQTLQAGDVLRLPIAGPFYTVIQPIATANRTLTLPDATTTLGGLSVAQTWSADQTWSARALFANGTDAAPGIAFSTDPGWGFYFDGSTQIAANGANIGTLDGALITLVPPLQVNDAITASGDITGAAVVSVSSLGVTTRQAATQDAVRLLGRAGGTGSHVATITPPTLSGSITLTLPGSTATLATLDLAETLSNKTLTSAGSITVAAGSSLTVASDTDATTILGRARISSPAGDNATFAHFDHGAVTSVAVRQDNLGATVVNAPTGQTVTLRINNSIVATTSSTALTLASGVNMAMSGASTFTSGTGLGAFRGALVVNGTTQVETDLSGAGFTAPLQVNGISAATSSFSTSRWSNNNFPSAWIGAKSRGASVGTHTIVQAGDNLAIFVGNGSDGTAFRTAAQMSFEATGTPASGYVPGLIRLSTTNNSGSFATRATLDSSTLTLASGINLAMSAGNLSTDTTTGTKIATGTTQKLGFWNATPVVQPTAVADASGGATVDAEARAAINNLLSRMRTIGLIAP